jgi:TetR/AcrR family transcriptional regulator
LNSIFYRLKPEKQQMILDASIEEFTEKGYVFASTNTIVQKLNISKGSLFQYFSNKETLFRYCLETVLKEISAAVGNVPQSFPVSAKERIIYMADTEFHLMQAKPLHYRFITEIASTPASSVENQILRELGPNPREIFIKMMENAIFPQWMVQEGLPIWLQIITYVLEGLKRDFQPQYEAIFKQHAKLEEIVMAHKSALRETLNALFCTKKENQIA